MGGCGCVGVGGCGTRLDSGTAGGWLVRTGPARQDHVAAPTDIPVVCRDGYAQRKIVQKPSSFHRCSVVLFLRNAAAVPGCLLDVFHAFST